MNLKENIKNNIVIFDGAMGTYLGSMNDRYASKCEMANLYDPDLILKIHREYIDAGAQVITANTYGANRINYSEELAGKMISAGMEIAFRAAGDDAEVIASIGQINGEAELRTSEFIWMADRLLETGAKNFIFETQSDLNGIRECASHIKECDPDAFIIASFAVNDRGFTPQGTFARDIFRELENFRDIDIFGFNCGCSASYMLQVVKDLNVHDRPLIVMPNAGYMVIVNRKAVYKGSTSLFADKTAEMADHGAVILGGCCGTTPEHIKALKEALAGRPAGSGNLFVHSDTADSSAEDETGEKSRFFEKLKHGQKPIAVELDPPANADTGKFLSGISVLREAGADIITIADCPIGRARMDSSLLACKVQREYGMEAIPHMTCRDRNLNATQALMLGLYAEGVRNILLVTGDPVPSEEKDAIKAVYQFNSRKLAAFASSLREKDLGPDIHFFGALNVNARNFDIQLRLAKEKIENGMEGFFTQPVLTPQAFENLKQAREELDGYLLGGIIPVVSERNARFMDSEISGINVSPEVIEMYVGRSKEEAEELAVQISSEIARRIRPYVDGYYYMTPFQRATLIKKIIEAV